MEENVIYPRSQKELICVMEKACKEGRLLETILDEFARQPFHMSALWALFKSPSIAESSARSGGSAGWLLHASASS